MIKAPKALRQPKLLIIPALIGGIFATLAGKIAATPQALPYDEVFHFGLIKIYARSFNPFLAAQPDGGNAYGAVARDPSYLFHYLMSFPYRLVSLFTQDQMTQMIALRWVGILLGLVSLYLVYRLARRIGLSTFVAQLVALGLAVTPVFYDVAAQINYDNLQLTLVLASILLTINVAERFRTKHVPVQKLLGLVALVLLASIVKYSYLPLGFAIAVYLAVVAVQQFGVRGFLKNFTEVFRYLSLVRQVLLVVLVLVAGGMWFQRDGMNIVKYHTPHPQCHNVLSVAACSEYPVWQRNYTMHQNRAERPQTKRMLVTFSAHWVKLMYSEIYGTIYVDQVVKYAPVGIMPAVAPAVIAIGLTAALCAYSLFLKRSKVWLLMIVVAGVYLATLWGQNMSDFIGLHQFIGIQGRYLLPVLPMLYLIVAAGYGALYEQLTLLERGRIRAMVSALFVIGWLGLRSLRRIGSLVLAGFTLSPAATQAVDGSTSGGLNSATG